MIKRNGSKWRNINCETVEGAKKIGCGSICQKNDCKLFQTWHLVTSVVSTGDWFLQNFVNDFSPWGTTADWLICQINYKPFKGISCSVFVVPQSSKIFSQFKIFLQSTKMVQRESITMYYHPVKNKREKRKIEIINF